MRDIRILVLGCVALFCGIALLAVFLLTGETRQARLLAEYEADRTATALLETVRLEGSLTVEVVDPRIKAFGIYDGAGASTYRYGDAPETLDAGPVARRFQEDPSRPVLRLVRPVGMDVSEMQQRMGMRGRMPGGMNPRGRQSLNGPIPGENLYLAMDITAYAARRRLLGAATILAPILVTAAAAAFLLLLSSAQRYRRKAEESEKLARLGETARTLAHEIRNPLGAIRMQTALLRRERPGVRSIELDVIDEEVERLTGLTRRVGEYLRDPRGRPEPIALDGFLRDLSGRLPWPVDLRATEGPEPAVVRFDRELLRSVVENLARNAHESYGEDAEARPIEVETAREGGRISVAVRDRGRGIPKENAGKVFDPFYTDKVQGSGIGLAISRAFVEAAGGTLTLAARPGGGTEARVSLPVQGPA